MLLIHHSIISINNNTIVCITIEYNNRNPISELVLLILNCIDKSSNVNKDDRYIRIAISIIAL